MDMLDRLLGHDLGTTRHVLELCRGLSDEQLDREFDIGYRTLRETLDHMIANIEIWTALMAGDETARAGSGDSIEQFIQRHAEAYERFATLARQLQASGRLDDMYLDTLDDPPTAQTFGGTIVHVVTHDMLHRSEALHILQRLGVPDLPEGDVLSWEMVRQTG